MPEPEDRDAYRLVDVEPVKKEDVHRYTSTMDRAASAEVHLVDAGAIPQRPAHVCPNCDYNLTGLIARRCPECGEAFTVLEARMRGIELSESVQSFVRLEWISQFKLYAGIALLALSVWLANFYTGSVRGWLGLDMSFRGVLMLSFLPALLFLAVVYKITRDRSWPDALWLAGLIAAGLSVFLKLL